MVFTSYSACYGSYYVNALPRPANRCQVPGMLGEQVNDSFNDFSPISLASIGDGLGQTLFITEKSTTTFRRIDRVDPTISPKSGWWIAGNWGDTLMSTFYPPNLFKQVGPAANYALTRSASSLHPGGVNALMGDGSVHFIKEMIDTWPFDPFTGNPAGSTQDPGGWWVNLPKPGIWQSLATPNGREVVADSEF